MEKRTLEYVSPETPHRLLAKRQLANIKAGLDTGPERQSFTPEFWQRMEDFLLMMITPACSHQAIRQQAIGENGWWRRVGRQRKAGKEAQRVRLLCLNETWRWLVRDADIKETI
jgi:hypothetical protein